MWYLGNMQNGLAVSYGLDDKQAVFVNTVIDGMRPQEAALASGYPALAAFGLLRLPNIMLAMRSEVARRLRSEGAAVGYQVLVRIARDEDAPKGVRAQCAMALLDRAGHVAPRAEAAAPGEKTMSEMTPHELLDVINECEGELAGRARPVNAPELELVDSQDADIYG